jgi:hypothetical protein
MNKYYLIAPLVLLTVFVYFYRGAKDDMAHAQEVRIAAENTKKADEAARKLLIEKKAQEEAIERQKQREADEDAKRLKKEKEYNDNMARLESDTKGLLAESDKFTKESNELEIALLNARSQRDKASRDAFELSKQVELAKVSRRSAELEIQRLIEMIGVKTSTSSLAVLPPPPPVKK